MQSRFFFATVGHIRPRKPTSLVKPRVYIRFSQRGIRIHHGLPIWLRSSGRDGCNTLHVGKCLKHRLSCDGKVSRCLTTGKILRQEDLVTLQHPQDITSFTETKPTECIEINSTKKPPNSDAIPRVRHMRSISLARLDISGRLTSMSGKSMWKRFRQRTYMGVRRSCQRIRRKANWNPLAAWLDATTRSDRAAIWADQLRRYLHKPQYFSLPTILLCYLEGTDAPISERGSLATTLDEMALPALQRSGFTPEDVDLWSNILTAPTIEQAAQRFVASQHRTPTFVLLEILRRPRLSPHSFRSLLVHSYFLAGMTATPTLSNFSSEEMDLISSGAALPLSSPERDLAFLEQTTFEVMACRLIRHARKVWPSALPSISNMVVSYCRQFVGDELSNSPQIYARICKIYNMMLLRLSLPASINPMKSMTYNWEAQKILIRSAAKFRPPLQLDRSAYYAVTTVLLAARKSPEERRYASLMQRTWPPWRKELDGMDANRSPKKDISRVVAALYRMREAGYAEDAIDRALKILGGREPDGTPAVQTRQIIKVRRKIIYRNQRIQIVQNSKDYTGEWAARIHATRDVYEAWEAFQGITRYGQQPSHSMYRAMFEKLIYRTLTNGLLQNQEAVAGDAKEPLAMLDDNISQSERFRIQPPSVDVLFSRMLGDGIRPSGPCLEMLIKNASTIEKVALYMRHGAVPSNSLIELLRKPTEMRRSALDSIPHGTFTAFIRFLCRFGGRRLTNRSEIVGREEPVAQFYLPSDPIIHAFELVKHRQSSDKMAWLALFRALSQGEFVFDVDRGQYENDIMSWQLLQSFIGEYLKAGILLDSDGFWHICICLEKALLASPHVEESATSYVKNGSKLVKEIFANLTKSVEVDYNLPRLLHRIVGYHLHAYIRVLGHIEDFEEVMVVLEWMVKHQKELTTDAKKSNKDLKLLRRSLIAVRAFFSWNEVDEKVVDRLRAVMCQLNEWGGWPTDSEVEHYLAYDGRSDPLDD